jgi:hypothetical protein
MPVLRGETSQLHYGEQSAFLTAAASQTRWLGAGQTVDGLFPDIDWKDIYSRGLDRDAHLYVRGARKVEGSVRLYPQFNSLRILKYAFGKVTHSGAGDPFTHTMEGLTGAVDLPPITLRRGYSFNATNEYAVLVRDAIVDSLELSGAEEDVLQAVLGVKGGKVTHSSTAIQAAGADITNVFPFHNTSGQIDLNGVNVARIRSFRFKLENSGNMGYYYQGTDGDYPYEYVPGKRRYTLEAEVVPIDDSFMTMVDATTPITTANFNIKFIGQTGPERSLEIKGDVGGNTGVVKSAPHNIPEEGEIVVPVSYMVNKCQLIALDGISGATWDANP